MKTKAIRLLAVGTAFLFLFSVMSVFCVKNAKADGASISFTESSVNIGDSVGFTISAPEGVTYSVTYTLSYGTPPTSPATVSGSAGGSFTAGKSGELTLTANLVNTSDLSDTLTASKTITVNSPSFTLSKESMTYSETDNIVTATVSNEPTTPGTFTASPAGLTPTGNKFTVDQAGNYTVTYTYTDGTETKTTTKALTVTMKAPNVTAQSENVTIRKTDKKTLTLGKDTPASQAWITPTSTNTAVATATMSGDNVIIEGVSEGTAVITVGVNEVANKYKGQTRTIAVKVLSDTAPLIEASPDPLKLDKNNKKKDLTITLTNPSVDSNGYAPVTVKVISPKNGYNGIEIDGTRKKAGVTYAINMGSASSKSFSIPITARRSATYTLQISNGSNKETVTVIVTGLSSLPQTGPDFTLVYVFAGLLLLAGAGLVVINVLKKKNNGVN